MGLIWSFVLLKEVPCLSQKISKSWEVSGRCSGSRKLKHSYLRVPGMLALKKKRNCISGNECFTLNRVSIEWESKSAMAMRKNFWEVKLKDWEQEQKARMSTVMAMDTYILWNTLRKKKNKSIMLIRLDCRAKMTQWVEVLAAQPEDQNLMCRTMVERIEPRESS